MENISDKDEALSHDLKEDDALIDTSEKDQNECDEKDIMEEFHDCEVCEDDETSSSTDESFHFSDAYMEDKDFDSLEFDYEPGINLSSMEFSRISEDGHCLGCQCSQEIQIRQGHCLYCSCHRESGWFATSYTKNLISIILSFS